MFEITLPQAGQSMEEGTILLWHKQEGEQVEKGEILLEIETDKATLEVESTHSGTLRKILCPEGETVPVLTVLALVGDATEEVPSRWVEGPEERAPGPAAESAQACRQSSAQTRVPSPPPDPGAPESRRVSQPGRVRASPSARKAARDYGIDLATLGTGSGPKGRILPSDVVRAAGATLKSVQRRMTPMRKAIARSVSLSKQKIPHFYMRLTIDAGPLLAFYQEQKNTSACTLNDIIALACGRVLRDFPSFRSRIDQDEVVEMPSANLGIAVGTEEGLVVPVITGADRLTLGQLAAESRRIIEMARRGKVEGMGKGVLTITNLGMFGVEEFCAIINPPESAILAVGAVREDVIVQDGAIRAGRLMTMTLSCDHRLVDGLLAAEFLGRLKKALEDPATNIP